MRVQLERRRRWEQDGLLHCNMAATAAGESGCSGASCRSAEALAPAQPREIIKPSVTELTNVRTNILCTVQGCGKILPNTPALNMHLVKSHRVKVLSAYTAQTHAFNLFLLKLEACFPS